MSAVRSAHQTIAGAIVLLGVICGVWALFNQLRGQPDVSPNLYSGLVATEIAVIVQALLGVAMSIAGYSPSDWKHFLYGFLAVLVLPAAYSWTRGYRRASLVIAATALFLSGLGIRAYQTCC